MTTILRGELGRLHRQKMLQNRPDLAPAGADAAASSSKAEPAVRGPPPGLQLGAEPGQLMRGVEEACPDLKNEPVEPIAEGSEAVKKAVEDVISNLSSKIASDAAAVKATENGGGPKKQEPPPPPPPPQQQQQSSGPVPSTLMPASDMKALLKAQRGLLAVPEDSVRVHLLDVLQRKLAKAMPSCTSLSAEAEGGGGGGGGGKGGKGKGGGGVAAALQAGVEQLKGRFAVAKGRHVVRYAGYDAALELLKLLADRNDPAVTAVLKLNLPGPSAWAGGTDLTVDGPEGVAVAAGERCKGEFLVSFDVRGVLVKPRKVLPLVSGGSGFVLRAADMLTTIANDWDTVGLEVAAGTAPGATAAPKKPDVDPMLATLLMLRPETADPDLPPSLQPGFALALCGCAMQRLHLDDDRGACVVVQWDDAGGGGGGGGEAAATAAAPDGAAMNGKGGGKQQKKRKGGFRITLAELDVTETGRGIVLQNSPGVAGSAIAAAEAASAAAAGQSNATPKPPLSQTLARLDAVLTAVRSTLRSSFGSGALEHAAFGGCVREFVRQKHGRFGASGLPTDTLFEGGFDD